VKAAQLPSGKRLWPARGNTVAAADTFHAVGILPHLNIHLAGSLTGIAVRTFSLIDAEAVKGDGIEQTVDRTEGTEVFAKRPVQEDGKDDQNDEDQTFPYEQKTCGLTNSIIEQDQRPAGHQRSRRTDPLTEPGLSLPYKIHDKQRKQDDEAQQYSIFQQPQITVAFDRPYFPA